MSGARKGRRSGTDRQRERETDGKKARNPRFVRYQRRRERRRASLVSTPARARPTTIIYHWPSRRLFLGGQWIAWRRRRGPPSLPNRGIVQLPEERKLGSFSRPKIAECKWSRGRVRTSSVVARSVMPNCSDPTNPVKRKVEG